MFFLLIFSQDRLMILLIAVFLPASPFTNFGDFCQPPNPPRLLFWVKFASLPVYSVLPLYLKLESTTLTNSKSQWEYRQRSQFFSYANKGSWKRTKGKSRLVSLWKMQRDVYQWWEFVLPWEKWSPGWNS